MAFTVIVTLWFGFKVAPDQEMVLLVELIVTEPKLAVAPEVEKLFKKALGQTVLGSIALLSLMTKLVTGVLPLLVTLKE